ncbi:hypothetical protein D0Y65_042012 [Glycine soja]|uniref:Uncharacterized protein n=1 Tax=Glycine soja TaxID=3848 RepID=A0A445GY78_GLYSO|nr:hypothetical protein D0Y65_042012 [Glycine soja]
MLFDFNELCASWDSYLMARTTLSFATVPMVQVLKIDSLIHVEELKYEDTLTLNLNPDPYPNLPGGSAQTKEYYSNSSLRKRKSLDRSSSIRRIVGVVAKMDELKVVANVGVGANAIARVTSDAFADYCVWHFRDLNKISIITKNTLH